MHSFFIVIAFFNGLFIIYDTINIVIESDGTKNKCTTEFGVETSITAPVYSKTTKDYNTITLNYTSGSAISGIKNTSCYRTDENGNVVANGTLSGNNCVFSGLANAANTTYYFKKCITSNAGNTSCSSLRSETITGYCTQGNYDKVFINSTCGTYGSCNKSCGGGTRYATKTNNYYYRSKYNNIRCGNNFSEYENNGCSESCNTQSCCNNNYDGDYKIFHDRYNPTDRYKNECYVTYCRQWRNSCTGAYTSQYCDTAYRNKSCSGVESVECSRENG